MSDLEGQLARNEALWHAWSEEGVTENTPLAVDFNFYATTQEAANRLAEALRESDFQKVQVRATRTLFIFKGWKVWMIKDGTWSLNKLQDLTRTLCRLAEACHCRLEGCGAMMPNQNNAELA